MNDERDCVAMMYGAPLVVESIHHDSRILEHHGAVMMAVQHSLIFVSTSLALTSLWFTAVSSWFSRCVVALLEIKNEAQRNIDLIYKEAIQCYYQAYNKADEQGSSLLKTMIRSNLAEIIAQYGHYLYKNDRHKDALKYYTQTIALVPSHLSAITQQGMCYAKEQNLRAARRSFESILKVTDRFQEIAYAMLNIAWTFRLEKNTQKALEYIRSAKQWLPYDEDVIAEENHIVALVSSQAYLSSLHQSRLVFQAQSDSSEERVDEWVKHMDSLFPPAT